MCTFVPLFDRQPVSPLEQVWEKASIAGGVATSENVGCQDDWINDGVQGGAPTYRNTLLFHQKFGFEPTPVNLRVSFGKGTTAWNNVTETELVRTHRASIRRFGQVLQWWVFANSQ